MKCIKRNDGLEIKRVSNEKADELVDSKKWSYCSKKEWKLYNSNNQQ